MSKDISIFERRDGDGFVQMEMRVELQLECGFSLDWGWVVARALTHILVLVEFVSASR